MGEFLPVHRQREHLYIPGADLEKKSLYTMMAYCLPCGLESSSLDFLMGFYYCMQILLMNNLSRKNYKRYGNHRKFVFFLSPSSPDLAYTKSGAR